MSGIIREFGPYQGYEHVHWGASFDVHGRLFIKFTCIVCKDSTVKRCSDVNRVQYWANVYARMHPPRRH